MCISQLAKNENVEFAFYPTDNGWQPKWHRMGSLGEMDNNEEDGTREAAWSFRPHQSSAVSCFLPMMKLAASYLQLDGNPLQWNTTSDCVFSIHNTDLSQLFVLVSINFLLMLYLQLFCVLWLLNGTRSFHSDKRIVDSIVLFILINLLFNFLRGRETFRSPLFFSNNYFFTILSFSFAAQRKHMRHTPFSFCSHEFFSFLISIQCTNRSYCGKPIWSTHATIVRSRYTMCEKLSHIKYKY